MLLFLKSLCGYGTAIYFHQIGSEVGMAKRRVDRKEKDVRPTRARARNKNVNPPLPPVAHRMWGAPGPARMWGGATYRTHHAFTGLGWGN